MVPSELADEAWSRARRNRGCFQAPRESVLASDVEDLARIHDVGRVDRTLYPPHHLQSPAMFGLHMRLLAKADPMFAGAGAAHFLCDPDEGGVDLLGLGALRQ